MRNVFGWLNRYKSVFLLGLAGLLFLLAQSAFWLNQTIFDQQTFTTIVGGTLSTEQSREAIAQTVVDHALEERPLLQRTISAKATQLITGLLGTDLATQTFDTVINRTYTYLTSNDPRPIGIDLLAIKTPLAGLVSFAETLGRDVQFDPEVIPDFILLFDPSNLPDVYAYGQKLLWIGPLLWLSAAGMFAAYLYRGRRALAKRVYIVGSVIIGMSLLGSLAGPLLPAPVAASVNVVELRGVVSSLASALLAPFVQQMFVTIGITAAVLMVFNQRFNILHLAQALAGKVGYKSAAIESVKPATKTKRAGKSKKAKGS